MKLHFQSFLAILFVFSFLLGTQVPSALAVTQVEDTVTITATVPAPTPPASPGGGGGGGYSPPPATNVVFSGRAYPKSQVTLLKDAQLAGSATAGTDASFQFGLSGLSAGNYIFSLYSEDKDGVRSSLISFPVSITSGATTTVSGIFIAPTIAVDKREVKRGEDIAIFGQSPPQADIVISVNSDQEYFAKTVADNNGVYLYQFDTSLLEYGLHNTKSKASLANILVSSYSRVVSFKVGTATIEAEPPSKAVKADANGDGRVNLVDFSVAAYWYKRPSPSPAADLNSDGKVDLVDFSIMAFYWTG